MPTAKWRALRAPPRACLTCDVELFVGDLGLQVDPPPLLCVVHPAEAGDVYYALLVHVHVAGCGIERAKSEAGHTDTNHCFPQCLGRKSTSGNELLSNLMLCYNVSGDIENC